MNELQIFNNEEFGQIRTVEINGEPWFVGKDIAQALQYENPQKAIRDHVEEEDKKMGERNVTPSIIDSLGREQFPIYINESGMYSLILSSKLPTAKRFKHWVTSAVIPSIRKNGGYIAGQENLTPEQVVANALIVAQNIIKQREAQIEEMKPKAEFFDAVTDSKDAISMNEVAKVLNFKGVGRNKLFEILRNQKILDNRNIPYQRYIDASWFRTIEQKYSKGADTCINIKTLVFQKGVEKIRELLEESGYATE